MNPEEIPLRDLHLPDPVGWWPPAPGWWLLIALALAALGWYLLRVFASFKAGRPRRRALQELARIDRDYAADGDAATLAARLSQLLRRAMLAYAPRSEVAGLTGNAWLDYLDRGLPEPLFSQGPGRELDSLPYRGRDGAAAADANGLLDAVRRRLETPLPEERA